MKNAFTLIEVVFSIVIIGILASVSTSRFASTRMDAKIFAEIAGVKIVLTNLGAEYATKNAFIDYTEADASKAVKCFRFNIESDGNVTVDMIPSASTECPHEIYTVVKSLATNTILSSSGSSRLYVFGGSSIKR